MPYSDEQLRYLRVLSQNFPTIAAAASEIIRIEALLRLPKGTEHFISDLHGEHEAFVHILNSASGVIREKIDQVLGDTVPAAERAELATLVYYPAQKLPDLKARQQNLAAWYRKTLLRLIELCRLVSSKHTRAYVRSCLPANCGYILDELLHAHFEDHDKDLYYGQIIDSILRYERADAYIIRFCEVIKHLAVDKLHILGDLYDRGPRPDRILDQLLVHHDVDIQWGNHDVVWMGAAAGSPVCIFTVLKTSLAYGNIDLLETGYGISLRGLERFATTYYARTQDKRWVPHLDPRIKAVPAVQQRNARMHKAVTLLLFKLEARAIARNPDFGMQGRDYLNQIDYAAGTVRCGGKTYPLTECDFPTVDPADPTALTPDEQELVGELVHAFTQSERLQRHVQFLYARGAVYKVINGNLLFHGCIPMTADGELMSFSIGCKALSGKAFLDYADLTARRAYYSTPGSAEREFGMDFLWFLWAGRNSPIFGRARMTTFERRFIEDESTWVEEKNPYYQLYNDPAVCERLLKEFGLEGPHCHIINGHIPVKSKKGESPIKGGGKLLVIDGGFCKAYQKTTGIAGYTLIYNSACLRLVSHQPFGGRDNAIRGNQDIASTSVIFERMEHRMKIAETDVGRQLQEQIRDLMDLLAAFRSGAIVEDHKE